MQSNEVAPTCWPREHFYHASPLTRWRIRSNSSNIRCSSPASLETREQLSTLTGPSETEGTACTSTCLETTKGLAVRSFLLLQVLTLASSVLLEKIRDGRQQIIFSVAKAWDGALQPNLRFYHPSRFLSDVLQTQSSVDGHPLKRASGASRSAANEYVTSGLSRRKCHVASWRQKPIILGFAVALRWQSQRPTYDVLFRAQIEVLLGTRNMLHQT
jgi:hypothetical protein